MAVAYILGGFAIAATILSTLRFQHWWVRVCDFPRIHITALGVVAITLWLAAGGTSRDSRPDAAFGAALAFALALQLWRILPFTPLWPKEVHKATDASAPVIAMVVSNVQMENRNIEALTDFIEAQEFDLVLLLECDDWWVQQLTHNLVDYPHSVLHPRDDTYGMALYSKLELVQPHVRFISGDESPSIHTGVRLKNGDLFRFHGLHPPPPVPKYSDKSVDRDAELMVVGRELTQDVLPCIVAGDINDVAWSRTTRLFCSVSGLLDPRVGRGPMPTFPVNFSLLRFPLDQVFLSAEFRLIDFGRGPDIASDHFPVFVKVSYEPTLASEQEPEVADAEAEADELAAAAEGA
ncbi:MAG: endonuclease/exonuclease/phosphatase family protein [Acidobacteria bacterium]|nr:endonuclease/exonuclease/phosphatase family protein [Acidobacteriota bacterium]MDA1234821.1 endonuclease/exonuclease/phosphatase family protein [Acidobacteriota bacterium]